MPAKRTPPRFRPSLRTTQSNTRMKPGIEPSSCCSAVRSCEGGVGEVGWGGQPLMCRRPPAQPPRRVQPIRACWTYLPAPEGCTAPSPAHPLAFPSSSLGPRPPQHARAPIHPPCLAPTPTLVPVIQSLSIPTHTCTQGVRVIVIGGVRYPKGGDSPGRDFLPQPSRGWFSDRCCRTCSGQACPTDTSHTRLLFKRRLPTSPRLT